MHIKNFIGFLMLILICNQASAGSVQDKSSIKALIFHSYQPQERSDLINRGLQETLEKYDKKKFVFQVVNMDYDSLGHMFAIYEPGNWKKYQSRLKQERERLLREMSRFQPDLVVICDDEVAHLTAENINKLGIPLFFLGINESIAKASWYKKSNQNIISGLLESFPIKESINMFRKIVPVNRVSLLSGSCFSSRLITEHFVEELKKYGIEVVGVYNLSEWSKWQEAVAEINKSSDLVWVLVPFHIFDSTGMEQGLSKIGNFLYENLTVPSSGLTDIHVRAGIFAAISPSTYDLGRQSAEQIIRYLNASSLKSIGITNNRYYDFDINTKTAKKLNLVIPDELIALANARQMGKLREKEGAVH